MKLLVALTHEISSIYSRGHEDEIQPDSAAGRKWFHTMAGRDENGRQTARRHTTGVSEEGKIPARTVRAAVERSRSFLKRRRVSSSRKYLSQLWLTLAERHLEQRGVDWKQAEKVCFNEWSNPDDEELGIQIVKVRRENVYPFYNTSSFHLAILVSFCTILNDISRVPR